MNNIFEGKTEAKNSSSTGYYQFINFLEERINVKFLALDEMLNGIELDHLTDVKAYVHQLLVIAKTLEGGE